MKPLSPRSPLHLISIAVLIAFINMTIGCSYYKVGKTVEDQSTGTQTADLAGQRGGPATNLQQFKKGTPLLIKLKDRSVVNKYFMFSDKEFIYVGTTLRGQDQKIAVDDIQFVKRSDMKYFILHEGSRVWHLKYIMLNDEKTALEGEIEPLPDQHKFYLTAKVKTGSTNRYKPTSGDPTQEVHIYTPEIKKKENNTVSIPLSEINKLELYKADAGAKGASIVLGTIAVVAIIGVIIAATKSSCPFVYTQNKNSYAFAGEIYGGALYPSLEREDYLPLPDFQPSAGQYQLKITNELLERQYTNVAELMVVNHPENTSVLLDKNGLVHTIGTSQPPLKARSGRGSHQLQTILHKDSNAYVFDEGNLGHEELSDLLLTFKKPVNVRQAKLILNAKNSLWLDYIYGKFTEQFGTSYDKFMAKQKKVPVEKLIKWSREQEIPLSVYVETKTGWRFVDYFNVIGPLASRDMVMSLDLSDVVGDAVHIKLGTGFMFWEIDYAAMDFSENPDPELIRILPRSATDENGIDVTSLLAATDSQYVIQPEIGNEVTVIYPAPPRSAKQTIILHSRGYYEHIRTYKNKPNLARLYSFKKKGSFTRFSRASYNEFGQSKDLFPIAIAGDDGNQK